MQIRRQSSADASVPGVQGPKPRTIWILGPAKDGSPTTLRFPLAKSYCLQKYLPWHFPKQLSSLETSQGTMLSLGGTILATQSLFQNYLNWIEFSHRIGVPKCIGSVLSVLKNKQKKTIGLAKNFIQVFLYHLLENSNKLFGQPNRMMSMVLLVKTATMCHLLTGQHPDGRMHSLTASSASPTASVTTLASQEGKE